MRRFAGTALALSLAACGGDTTPLPPLTVGPEWMPLMLDTTGNMMIRRMALWVDTAHVTTSPAGFAQTAQRMHMDMKIGGISSTMRTKLEVDCTSRRYRLAGLDSIAAMVDGKPMPDSIARQALAQQKAALSDTTWRTTDSLGDSTFVGAVCARAGAPGVK